jgi:hypothetical protein
MTRKERRAAEHAARKADRKAGFPSTLVNPATDSVIVSTTETTTEPVVAPTRETSAVQIAANRANSRLSTGAKTEAGKAKCSHNAVKTALTGQTVLLPNDSVAAYENLGQLFLNQYKPATPEEERLVQSLIDSEWRLMRIPALEAGIYAVGREELADSVPAHLLETHVYLTYERNLKNLHLQENRLRRNREKDLKALKELQAACHEREAILHRIQQMKAKQKEQEESQPQSAPEIGFVFETPEIAAGMTYENAA